MTGASTTFGDEPFIMEFGKSLKVITNGDKYNKEKILSGRITHDQ